MGLAHRCGKKDMTAASRIRQVQPAADPPSPQSRQDYGNGGRDNTGERLARLEERMQHLATKAEITGIAKDLSDKIGNMQNSNLKFYVITLCSAIGLAIGVLMLYIHLSKS